MAKQVADLFTFAAEREAIATGFSADSHRIALMYPDAPDAAEDLMAVWLCLCGGKIGKDPLAACDRCKK